MNEFKIDIQQRWADLDPNFHFRHSVYDDWATHCRVEFLDKYDLNAAVMQRLLFGPILFREECVFKKELLSGDKITIDLKLVKAKRDFSRWSIQHTIWKNADILAAVVTVDGAWINTAERKLAIPPENIGKAFRAMPVDNNFQWID
jgi:acyl-CoA thioester hydrolase